MTDDQPSPEAAVEAASRHKAYADEVRSRVRAVFHEAGNVATPSGWRVALETIRGLQDSLEEALKAAIIMRGAYERWEHAAKFTYDSDWARQSDADAHRAVRRGPEMEGPRERYARQDLKVFDQLHTWRLAEQALSVAAETENELWLRYRAVNATREDIHAILRATAFEQSLERT